MINIPHVFIRLHRATGHYYSIGLMADFAGFAGFCPYEECEAKCNGCTLYRCPGCRHRWQWLDGSPAPSSVQGRGVFDNWHQDHPYQDEYTAYKCGTLARTDATTAAWYSIDCGSKKSPFICKRGK